MNLDYLKALFGLHSVKVIAVLSALNAAYLILAPVFTMPSWVVAIFNIIGLIATGYARTIPQPHASAELARVRASI